MENWLAISTTGYLLLAIEAVITKILLTNKVKSWQLYSFYVGLLSLSGVFFAPFGLKWFGFALFFESLLAGSIFFLALIFLYKSLKKSSASRVFVLYGAITTLASFFWEHFLLGTNFSYNSFWGIGLLMIGGILISFKIHERRIFSGFKMVIFSGFLMALALIMMKDVFNQQNFITGYVFSRLGIFLSALFLLISPVFRRTIKKSLSKKSKKDNQKNFGFILGAKVVSGAGTLLVNYSISLGSVAVINALVSVQYSFVFIITLIVSVFWKKIIKETITRENILLKLLGLILVVWGMFLIN